MYIDSVVIQGLHNVDTLTVYKLRDGDNLATYIVGPNGSGKTTILQAIQLALLGYIPGTNRRTSDIFKHAGGSIMTVRANLVDNGNPVTVERTFGMVGSKITSDVKIHPETYDIADVVSSIEAPIFNFNEFIGMSANALKDWFINFLPKAGSDTDVMEEIDKAIEPFGNSLDDSVYQNLKKLLNNNESTVEALRAMHKYIKEESSAKNAVLKSLQGTLESLVFYDDMNYEDEADFVRQKRELQELRDKAIKMSSAIKHNEQIMSELNNYSGLAESIEDDDLFNQSQREYDKISKKLDELYSIKSEASIRKSAVDRQIRDYEKIISTGGVCQYTGQVCNSIAKMIDEMKAKIVELNKEKAEAASEIKQKDADIDALKSDARALEKAISDIRYKYVIRNQLKESIQEVDTTAKLVDVEVIDSQIKTLDENIVKCRANKKYNEMTQSITADKFSAECDLAMLKVLEKLTGPNGLQSSMMSNPFDELSKKMDIHLKGILQTDDVESKFDLTAKANSFNFGWELNGAYVLYDMLSSGEKCIFALSLMLSIVEISDSPLKLVMIDDLLDHLDSSRYKALMGHLIVQDGVQIILAGVKEPVENLQYHYITLNKRGE